VSNVLIFRITLDSAIDLSVLAFFARDAFVRTNRCAIAMMFVRPSLRLFVWDGRTLWSYGAL